MITQQELKKKIAHEYCSSLTAEEVSAITEELLNSNIDDGSEKSDHTVAFWMAATPDGRRILAANKHALALQIKPHTLNTVVEHGDYAGYSVASWLADREVSILAAHDCFLGSKINQKALNTPINEDSWSAGLSVAACLARVPEGRTILAAKGNAVALLITPQILESNITSRDSLYCNKSIASILKDGSQTGADLLNAIQEEHQRINKLMLTSFSSRALRSNPKSSLKSSHEESEEERIGSKLDIDLRSKKKCKPSKSV